MKQYNWACLGCGHIANEMAHAMEQKGKTFYSVANRTTENAKKFAEKYNISKVYDNVDDIFSDENVDIIYIATVHNKHIDQIMKSIENGKHVLCEKAITLNMQELDKAMKAAKEKNVIIAEAMTIFHMPVYDKLFEIINSGKLGVLKLIQVNLGSCKDYDMTNRFFNMELAGGAMLDIGVYALSFARLFMSENASEIHSTVKFAPSGADEQVGIVLNNSKNEMAAVTLSLSAKLPKTAVAAFENGYIEVDNYNRATKAKITYTADGHTDEIIVDEGLSALCYEIEDMEKAVSAKENKMKLGLTADVMDIMTKLRNRWGMKYPEEM